MNRPKDGIAFGRSSELTAAWLALEAVGWLAGRCAEFRARLREIARLHVFARKEPIYLAGDTPNGMFGVVGGSVHISLPRQDGQDFTAYRSGRTMAALLPFPACALAALAVALGFASVQAEEPRDPYEAQYDGYTLADDDDYERDLRAASQNPIADLISVPIQNNVNFGVGPRDKTSWVLNVQPVIPIGFTDDLNLITRTIIPLTNRPSFGVGDSGEFGLGDINPAVFLSPRDPIRFDGGQFVWGAGAAFLLPTATDTTLGTGKLSVGPTAVGLVLSPPWVFGVVASNLWSVAGPDGREDVNVFTAQPFINYNLDDGWFLTSSPIVAANWQADEDRWTVPVGGGIGRVFAISGQPVNASLQAFGNVVSPDGIGPDWSIRLNLSLLFPR